MIVELASFGELVSISSQRAVMSASVSSCHLLDEDTKRKVMTHAKVTADTNVRDDIMFTSSFVEQMRERSHLAGSRRAVFDFAARARFASIQSERTPKSVR